MDRELDNFHARESWIRQQLSSISPESTILDIGAGEGHYRQYCGHLRYIAQDIAVYDGSENTKGLQNQVWNFAELNSVCDLLDMPEDVTYDAVLCTEVLEHVSEPVKSLEKIGRLLAPGGVLILTAPFCSLTHFAPYYFCSGFSEYFYRHHLNRLGFGSIEIVPNGGYFDYMTQELARIESVHQTYAGTRLGFIPRTAFKIARSLMERLAKRDGPRGNRKSAELLTFGWHVRARLRS